MSVALGGPDQHLQVLGFDCVRDRMFMQMVLARVIRQASKAGSVGSAQRDRDEPFQSAHDVQRAASCQGS